MHVAAGGWGADTRCRDAVALPDHAWCVVCMWCVCGVYVCVQAAGEQIQGVEMVCQSTVMRPYKPKIELHNVSVTSPTGVRDMHPHCSATSCDVKQASLAGWQVCSRLCHGSARSSMHACSRSWCMPAVHPRSPVPRYCHVCVESVANSLRRQRVGCRGSAGYERVLCGEFECVGGQVL